MQKVSKRVSTALLNALAAGVVPRIGLEHIAVGRDKEVAALAQDLENVGEGGAAFSALLSGVMGQGKAFYYSFCVTKLWNKVLWLLMGIFRPKGVWQEAKIRL